MISNSITVYERGRKTNGKKKMFLLALNTNERNYGTAETRHTLCIYSPLQWNSDNSKKGLLCLILLISDNDPIG